MSADRVKETPKGAWWVCDCGRRWWQRRQYLLHDPCPACGQHVGRIKKVTGTWS